MEPIVVGSARRHGVGEEDILHAYRNPMRFEDLDDGFVMIAGPDRVGQLIEIGVVTATDGIPLIVHALSPARPQYLP